MIIMIIDTFTVTFNVGSREHNLLFDQRLSHFTASSGKKYIATVRKYSLNVITITFVLKK